MLLYLITYKRKYTFDVTTYDDVDRNIYNEIHSKVWNESKELSFAKLWLMFNT